MKLKRTFELLAVKAAGNLILAGTIILAAACIALVIMIVMVTVGTVFGLLLPYKPIAALTALTALVVLAVSSDKYQKYLASTRHQAPDPSVGQSI
jgi:membrane protein implicated in regulation of membrane protease activity